MGPLSSWRLSAAGRVQRRLAEAEAQERWSGDPPRGRRAGADWRRGSGAAARAGRGARRRAPGQRRAAEGANQVVSGGFSRSSGGAASSASGPACLFPPQGSGAPKTEVNTGSAGRSGGGNAYRPGPAKMKRKAKNSTEPTIKKRAPSSPMAAEQARATASATSPCVRMYQGDTRSRERQIGHGSGPPRCAPATGITAPQIGHLTGNSPRSSRPIEAPAPHRRRRHPSSAGAAHHPPPRYPGNR